MCWSAPCHVSPVHIWCWVIGVHRVNAGRWQSKSGWDGRAAQVLETTASRPRESSSTSGIDSQARAHEEWTGELHVWTVVKSAVTFWHFHCEMNCAFTVFTALWLRPRATFSKFLRKILGRFLFSGKAYENIKQNTNLELRNNDAIVIVINFYIVYVLLEVIMWSCC